MKKIIPFLLVLTPLFLATGCGMTAGGLKDDPGYAYFNTPYFWEADEELHISLGPSVLAVGKKFIDDDEEFGALIADVRGIHLRVFDVRDNFDVLSEYIDTTSLQLQERGWETLVSSRDEDEYAEVMVKMVDTQIHGIVVLSAERDEAVFINIIGDIKPQSVRPLIAEIYDDAPKITTTL